MITFNGQDLIVQPPRYPSEEIKVELGGRWDKKSKSWRVAPTSLNVLTLVEWYGESILEGAPEAVRDLAFEPWGFKGFSEDEQAIAEAHPSWSTLYDFQHEGIEYLFCNPHGAALCNLSWGHGKAAVSVVTTDLLEAERILVLAPLTLAPAWRGEFERWSDRTRDIKRAVAGDRSPGPEVTIANHEVIQEVVLRDEHGKLVKGDLIDDHADELIVLLEAKDKPFLKQYGQSLYDGDKDWTTNPRLVSKWIKLGPTKKDARDKTVPSRERIVQVRRDYAEVDWDVIIVDESVLLKNRKAVKVDVLTTLRKKSDPIVIELSGSPITKTRADLYPQVKIAYPRGFASFWRFAKFFCVVDEGGWGWTIEGDRPDHDPHHYLRDLLWVKSDIDAGSDLPKYIEQPVLLDPLPQQAKALQQMVDKWIVELEDSPLDRVEASNWLARNTRLQQITSNMGTLPKPTGGFYSPASAKEDFLLQQLAEGEIETPLLVWSWYVETTLSISRRVAAQHPELRVGHIVGAMKTEDKDAAIAAYREGELDVLVMQMATGKFGHTFTNTKTVFYHDRAFDSDAYVQSLARVRRIGLKHRPVLIVPKVVGSADALIDLNLEGKLGNMARLTNADLAGLLRSLGT
jgi:SNF2 family DNA or RNA helicase